MGKRNFLRLMLVLWVFSLTGCASSVMQKVEPLSMEDNSDKALVNFMRPSFVGGAIQCGVWDSETFIGILSAGKYIQYFAEPGEHVFLGRGENWSYVKADLEAGKQYFILVRPFMGVWKARFAFDPLNKGDEEFSEVEDWLNKLTPTGVVPEKFEDYVTPRKDQVREAAAQVDNGEVKYRVLGKDDGI